MMLASYNNPCAYDYALLFTLILVSVSEDRCVYVCVIVRIIKCV